MSKVKIISTIDEAQALKIDILKSAEIAKSNIFNISNSNAIQLLFDLKFKEIGFEPLSNKPINLIEQLNQLFTYLVSIEGVIYLLKAFPNQSFKLNLGTASGSDIESLDNTIVAEVFSATSPKSNDKLKKDITRVGSHKESLYKYVFFYSYKDEPTFITNLQDKFPNVKIVKLSFDEYLK